VVFTTYHGVYICQGRRYVKANKHLRLNKGNKGSICLQEYAERRKKNTLENAINISTNKVTDMVQKSFLEHLYEYHNNDNNNAFM